MFGANKPTFGASANTSFGQSTSLFGAAAKPQTQTTTNLFGQPSIGISGTNALFSGSQMNTLQWGSNNISGNGTALAFNPPITTELLQRGGQSSQVNAKHICITAMKEYQNKSLEELRLEDYALNRRSQVAPTNVNTLFGSPTAKPFQFGSPQIGSTASIFGQANKPTNLFGSTAVSTNIGFGGANSITQSTFGQTSQGSLLGIKPQFGATTNTTNLFGSTLTTQSSGFSFGQANQNTSIFGSKPLFGAISTAPGSTLFGSAQNTQAGTPAFGFGQPQQQTAGVLGGSSNLFGQSSLASSTAKPGFFGSQANTGTGLTFGSGTTGFFGAPKPAGTTPVFGAGTAGLTSQPQNGFTFGNAAGAVRPAGNVGLFGNPTQSTAANALKPGGLFGTTSQTGTFGFNTGLNASQPSTFGFPGASASGGTLFGQSTTNSLGAGKVFSFATPVTSSTPGMGTFSFGQPGTTPGLFGAPSTSTFGLGTGNLFGTQSATGFGIGQRPQTVNALGGNTFGTGFGLGTINANNTNLANTGFGTGLTGGTSFGLGNPSQVIGSNLTNFGMSNQLGACALGVGNNTAEQAAQNIRAQQQVLELVRSMPYGQSSLFRYMNTMNQPASSASDAKCNSSTSVLVSTPGSNSAVVPARVVANALAEHNKTAALICSPSNLKSAGLINSRGINTRRTPNSNNIVQVTNRNKLFSGFYEEDSLASPTTQTFSSSFNSRRNGALDTTLSPIDNNSSNSNFFVKREKWRRLHLPENVRNSILQRSSATSSEFNQLSESVLNRNQTNGGDNVNDSNGELVNTASGDGVSTSSHNSSKSQTISTSHKECDKSTTDFTNQVQMNAPTSSDNQTPKRSGKLGFALVRDAFHNSAIDRDLDCTLASPANTTYCETSLVKTPPGSEQCDKFTDFDSANNPKPNSHSERHPAGLLLTKPGYYTLPTLDELDTLVDADGKCVVEDFVVGRKHYGHILFPGLTDVTGLNLDSIVHIRRREVVIYPDDEKKPPTGMGLNKRAEICLEAIWPTDKTTHEPIKSPPRLNLLRFEERLERATRRMDAKFIEYRPDSGSWVFEVKHFSKYRLTDSDEDDTENSSNMRLSSDNNIYQGEEHYVGSEKVSVNMIHNSDNELQDRVGKLLTSPSEIDSSVADTQLKCQDVRGRDGFEIKNSFRGFGVNPSIGKQMRSALFSPSSGTDDVNFDATDYYTSMSIDTEMETSTNCIVEDTKQRLHKPNEFVTSGNSSFNYLSTGATQYDMLLSVTRKSDMDKTDPQCTPEVLRYSSELSDNTESELNGYLLKRQGVIRTTTPFGPLPSALTNQGISLSVKSLPNPTTELMRLRLFAKRKTDEADEYQNELNMVELYPYDFIRQFISDSQSLFSHPSKLFIDSGLWHGHGFRSSIGYFRCHDMHSLAFITCYSQLMSNSSQIMNSRNMQRLIKFNGFPTSIELADEDMLNAALTTSVLVFQNGKHSMHAPRDRCPLWRPAIGLTALEAYIRVLNCDSVCTDPELHLEKCVNGVTLPSAANSARFNCFKRVFSFCHTLWGRHPQGLVAEAMAAESSLDRTFHSKCMDNGDENGAYLSRFPYKLGPSVTGVKESDDFVEDPNYPLNNYQELLGMQCLTRKQAVSEWIRIQSLPWLLKRLRQLGFSDLPPFNKLATPLTQQQLNHVQHSKLDSNTVGEALFVCLVSGEPSAACHIAISAGMSSIASLIAQSTAGDPVVRRGLQYQLNKWHDTKFDRHIPPAILRVYCLLAGRKDIPDPFKLNKSLHVFAGLEWIQVFGVYLWYLTDYDTNLANILTAYSHAWHTDKHYNTDSALPRPCPPTLDKMIDPAICCEQPKDFPTMDEENGKSFRNWPRDTIYHLLQLVRRPYHSLNRTLDPCCLSRNSAVTCALESTNLLDWAGVWHLWRVLFAYGYQCLDSSTTFGNNSRQHPLIQRLSNEFATQLEDAGLWEWAVFVLLHVEDETVRETLVKTLIARHVTLVMPTNNSQSKQNSNSFFLDLTIAPAPELTKSETFVVNRLAVPVRWLHEGKATLAHHRLKSFTNPKKTSELLSGSSQLRNRIRLFAILEASHWLAAGHVKAASNVLLKYILPDTLLRQNRSTATEAMPYVRFHNLSNDLGHRIVNLLQPFYNLPATSLPDDFQTGIGVYLSYGELLCLVDHLTELCTTDHDPKHSVNTVQLADNAMETNDTHLADILSKLHLKHTEVTEQLQKFKTTTLLETVVKTEMSAMCVHLTSAFLSANAFEDNRIADGTRMNSEGKTVDFLQKQLIAINKLGLPSDYRLKELRALAELKLSMAMV